MANKPGLSAILQAISGAAPTPMNTNSTEAIMGFPPIARDAPMPGVIDESGAMGSGMSGEDITVSSPKERKSNLLGEIADGILMAYGQKPIYRERLKEMRIQDAMEGFTDDPLGTIKRIGMYDPSAAWNMFNQHQDNERADVVANKQAAAVEQMHRDRIGSMLAAVNEGNSDKLLPLIHRYAERHGIDPTELPTEYDPDTINAWRLGALDVDDQMDNEREDLKLEALIDYREMVEEGRNARHEETQDRIDARQERTQDRVDARHGRSLAARGARASTGAAGLPEGAKRVNTIYGPGYQVGNRIAIKRPNGREVFYEIRDGRAIKIGSR